MKYIPNAVSRKIARQVLVGKKHSPAILFGAGVVGMVGTVVSASRATLKLEEVLDNTQKDLDLAEKLGSEGRVNYTEADCRRDMNLIRAKGAMAVCKLYAPALTLGMLSVAALTGSHVILSKRNAALAGAYATLEKGFNEYRKRVEEELGTEKEREIRYGTETVTEKDENGKDVEKKVVSGAAGTSIYARFFDQLCPSWSPTPEYNLLFLQCQQNYANDLLMSRGHVFLNEVYDMLGIERSKAGQFVGWTREGSGDHCVDFGIFDRNRESVRDFVNGREGAILLDFNVDGPIYDRI